MAKKQNEKIIRFMATKTVERPTLVSFRTKDGKFVSFSATEAVKVKAPVKFKTSGKK